MSSQIRMTFLSRKVHRIRDGNSFSLRLPKDLAKALGDHDYYLLPAKDRRGFHLFLSRKPHKLNHPGETAHA